MERKLTIKIPQGIDNGEGVRITGQGDAVYGGITGDLIIRVKIKKDSRFIRDGDQIMSQKTISFSQASLGDTIDVQTIDGVVELKIPAGTQPSTVFRLRGKGVPSSRGHTRGDHIVTIHIATPTSLSKKAKKLIEELQNEGF